MNVAGRLCADVVPKHLGSETVVVPWNDPPMEILCGCHRSERLPPDLIGRRLGIEEIAGNKHMVSCVVPRGGRQAVDRCVARFHEAPANAFRKVPEAAA